MPGYDPANRRSAPSSFPRQGNGPNATSNPSVEGEGDPRLADLADEDDPGLFADGGAAGPPGTARPEGRRRRRRRGRRRERPKSEPSSSSSSVSPIDDDRFRRFCRLKSVPHVPLPAAAPLTTWSWATLMISTSKRLEGPGREPFESDEFGGDELAERPAAPVEEEIDHELEQEIRREIEEIEELEREMGLRGPADARPRRGEDTSRGGRTSRGRGLVKPPIQEIFRRGDEVLVQVIKESIGTKGPTLSTYISIPGRYLVLDAGPEPRRRLPQDRR